MIRPFLLAAALLATQAHALDMPTTLGVHVGSLHGSGGAAPPPGGWNPVNPGIYGRWDSGLTMGVYYNSERRTSAYVAYTMSDSRDRFALTTGVVSGYRNGVFPLLVPSVRLPFDDRTSARVSLLAPPKGVVTLHLSIERRF